MTKIVKGTKKRVKGHKMGSQGITLRAFNLPAGLDNPTRIRSELQDMTDVLLGRKQPPIAKGVLTLMEVADAYFARATEIERLILQGEAEGDIAKDSPYAKLRTLEIRSFKEMAKQATDLGSRRLTAESLLFEKERMGRES